MADWPPHLVPILEVSTCSARGVRVALVMAKSFLIILARIVVDFTFAASQSLNAAPMNLEECEELFTTALPSLLTPYHMLSATSYPRRAITLLCIAAKKGDSINCSSVLTKNVFSCFFFCYPYPLFGRWPATMTGHWRNFRSVKSRFWPIKILGDKVNFVILLQFSICEPALALEDGLNRSVALTVDGYIFSNFDGSRLNFRAFNAYGRTVIKRTFSTRVTLNIKFCIN